MDRFWGGRSPIRLLQSPYQRVDKFRLVDELFVAFTRIPDSLEKCGVVISPFRWREAGINSPLHLFVLINRFMYPMECLVFVEWLVQFLSSSLKLGKSLLKPDRLINFNHDFRPISKKWRS